MVYHRNKISKVIAGFSVLFFAQYPVCAAESIKPIPLVKVKMQSAQLTKLCADLKLNCAQDIGLWKKKASTDQKFYLIDDTPQLIELNQGQGKYQLSDIWNFKDYQHHSNSSPDDDLADFGTQVFPAFYPLNKEKVAIALVKQWGTSYAGGGKGEHVADFLMLEPKGKYKVALADIPFYSYEMIRACFSEKEYKTSPHCHDESGSTLSIQFKDIGKPYYQWTLNYTDFTWASFKPEKTKTIEKYSEVVMPFGQKVK